MTEEVRVDDRFLGPKINGARIQMEANGVIEL